MLNLLAQHTRLASLNHWYQGFGNAVPLLLCSALCLGTASAQTLQFQAITPLTQPTLSTTAILETQPPAELAIVYENGLLTVTASNSTLHDVLQGIRDKTGAEIEIPAQAEERVASRVGPGLAREVVESLLTGSKFNYVLVGSAVDPKALTKVLLFLKPPPEHRPPAVTAAGAVPPPSAIDTAELAQPARGPSESELPVRSQQQMLQQHRQMIMEQFHQNSQPDK